MSATSPLDTGVAFGACTDVGTRRELNEDAVLADFPVFAVADGMGGHATGEIASALAIESMSALAGHPEVHSDDVIAAINAANTAIVGYEQEHGEAAGMGTTLSGVCLGVVAGSPHWLVFNVGDSRVYRFAGGALLQLTVDHSEVAELIASGAISTEESLTHPLRNVVTRSLGLQPPPAPDMWVLPAIPGERFLVCSDGLPLELSEEAIAAALAAQESPQEVADRLVRLAVSAGGRDNVSAVVVELSERQTSDDIDADTSPRPRQEDR